MEEQKEGGSGVVGGQQDPSLHSDGGPGRIGCFTPGTDRVKGEQGLPRARPGRCAIHEQVSRLSLAGGGGRVGQGVVREGGRAPVQGDREVQEGGHQLGGVVPGEQGDGLQSVLFGSGDADGAELQVDGLAQVGNLRARAWGERAGLSAGARPILGSLRGRRPCPGERGTLLSGPELEPDGGDTGLPRAV